MGVSTAFLVDGFNLYHSLRDAERHLAGPTNNDPQTRWLDLPQLCRAQLHNMGRNRHTELENIYYFSALAHFLEHDNPGVVDRHEKYLRCLRLGGVVVELGQFKRKTVYCKDCGSTFERHEEKETDVRIAARLFEVLQTGECDIAVIVSGDTDLVPAIKTAQRLYDSCEVWAAFPFNRHNNEVEDIADGHVTLKAQNYTRAQFPDPYTGANEPIEKPNKW